jgi:type I restriction enzyme S subunit
MVTLKGTRVAQVEDAPAQAEFRNGDRQTEMGTPEDWSIRSLGSIGQWFSGGTPSMSNPAYWEGDIPWVSPKDMKVSHLYDSIDHITTRAIEDCVRLISPGAILLVIRGMILAHSLPVARAERSLAFNQDIKAVVTTPLVNSQFLLYWFAANSQRLLGLTTESTHGTKRLPTEMLFRELVACPPTPEQEAIADALSDAAALIESLERLIAKKRQIKLGAMQQLLAGKKRLPGFEQIPGYRQTEIGAIPVEWEAKALVEIGKSLIGLTYKPSDVQSDGVLVLRSSNVQEGTVRFDDNVFVRMEVPERIMVRAGDILVCVRNGSRELIGKCALLDKRAEGMTFGAFMAVFRTPSYRFILHQFQSAALKRQINEHLGATINQITNKSLNSFLIPFPQDSGEREAVASVLSEMDEEIGALEAKLGKARQIKQGMMQELLTGRIRLV